MSSTGLFSLEILKKWPNKEIHYLEKTKRNIYLAGWFEGVSVIKIIKIKITDSQL